MTDAEISRRLALAIGWKCSDVRTSKDGRYITVPADPFNMRRQFDYRDPAVIWPIAERYNAFPTLFAKDSWIAYFGYTNIYERADTAAKAVALAVIKAHEGAKE